MIITCEECHTRYVVPGEAIGEDGRRVRCTQCGHEWFQDLSYDPDGDSHEDDDLYDEGDNDNNSFAEEMARYRDEDLEPIPESIKPLHDGSHVPVPGDKKTVLNMEWQVLAARLSGYAAAIVVFLCVLGALFAFHKPLVTLWPNMIVLFDMAGLDVAIEGETMTLNNISSYMEQDDTAPRLIVQGHIVNTAPQENALPHLRLSLLEQDGNVLDYWFISNAQSRIDGGADMSFSAVYPDLPDNAVGVRLDLVPSFMVVDRLH